MKNWNRSPASSAAMIWMGFTKLPARCAAGSFTNLGATIATFPSAAAWAVTKRPWLLCSFVMTATLAGDPNISFNVTWNPPA